METSRTELLKPQVVKDILHLLEEFLKDPGVPAEHFLLCQPYKGRKVVLDTHADDDSFGVNFIQRKQSVENTGDDERLQRLCLAGANSGARRLMVTCFLSIWAERWGEPNHMASDETRTSVQSGVDIVLTSVSGVQ
uniref:Uncharacterized protein n=1 Tax=Timema douglasi TaxID=61478 RepID=A0A7R8VJ10_TIMDO|nr:unnamed protein product [Timema douglasi]